MGAHAACDASRIDCHEGAVPDSVTWPPEASTSIRFVCEVACRRSANSTLTSVAEASGFTSMELTTATTPVR